MVHAIRKRLVVLLSVAVVSATMVAIFAQPSAAAPCDTGRNADIFISGSTAPSGSNYAHTFTVNNQGPACVPGVEIWAEVSGYLSFVSVDPGSWVCAPDGTLPSPFNVRCTLTSTLGVGTPGSSGTVQLLSTGAAAHALAMANIVGDDLFDNEIWVSFGTSVSTSAPAGPVTESTAVNVPSNASLVAQQVTPGNPPLGSDVSCDSQFTNCSGQFEKLVTAPSTNPNQFPRVHITITITRTGVSSTKGIAVHRYDDVGTWTELEGCGGFTGDPNIGCVKSMSLDKKNGTLTIIIWTSHNGHVR